MNRHIARVRSRPPRRRPRIEQALTDLADRRLRTGRRVDLPRPAGPLRAYVYKRGVYDRSDHDPSRPTGALLWIHGGGMIVGSPWIDHGLCERLAAELGIVVVSVDYRLPPEHPFPAAPDDCFAALTWLQEHAGELGVDPGRIGVAGASAGGGLAAAVAQMAHDRAVPVAFQGLVYPMLDDRTVLRGSSPKEHGGRGRLVWRPARNRDAWGWYLTRPVTPDPPPPYAAPARRAELAGLAPAWIGVGEQDLFLEEDIDYARRLEAAGVPVELVTVPRMPHAFDYLPVLPAAARFRDAFRAAVGRALTAAEHPS